MKKFIKILKITGITLSSIFIIAILFVVINSQFGNNRIEAEIDGLGTKLLNIQYNSVDGTEISYKYTFSINDKIDVNVPVYKLSTARFIVLEPRTTFRSRQISFFLQPDQETIIKGTADEFAIRYKIEKGNKLSYEKAEFTNYFLPYYIKESKYFHKMRQFREVDFKKYEHYKLLFNSLRFDTVAQLRTEWAKKHLDYELTPSYFLESHIPKDTVIKYNNLMSTAIKNSEYGKILDGIVSGWSKTKIGNIAPLFSQKTYSNKFFSLENQKGKYVVLDFWGTWCGPCLQGMPKMKEYYNKYNNQIEFVGIACNDKRGKWEEVIKDKQLNWTHILDAKSLNDLSTLYGVTNYPTKFIIDKQGKLIGRFNGENKSFYDKIDEIVN